MEPTASMTEQAWSCHLSIAAAREAAAAARRAEVEMMRHLEHAARCSRTDRPLLERGMEQHLELGGPGTTLVDEFLISQVALELHMSEHAALRLLGEAVELVQRLPRCWEACQHGTLTTERARRIAAATMAHPTDVVRLVDERIAPFAQALGPKRLLDVITAVTLELQQPVVEKPVVHHHVRVTISPGRADGYVEAAIPADTALRFEAAVARVAHALLRDGDESDLDTRRARALDVLANPDWHRALLDGHDTSHYLPRMVLHVTLTETALRHSTDDGVVDVDRLGPELLSTLRAWCGHHQVHVRPVLDVDALSAVDAYQVPSRIQEAVQHRHTTCVFPGCQTRARRCDLDHIEPYQPGRLQQTSVKNLAPLCRHHHRVKTHGGWTYRRLGPTTYMWTSPTGSTWVTGSDGSHEVTSPPSSLVQELRHHREEQETRRGRPTYLPCDVRIALPRRVPRRRPGARPTTMPTRDRDGARGTRAPVAGPPPPF